VNRETYEEIFDFIVQDLGLQTSFAAPSLFFGGNLGEANGVMIRVYVDSITIICKGILVASIASQLYDRFKATGHVPDPDNFQYRGMTVTRDRSTLSIAIDQIGSINRVFDGFEMGDCHQRSTPTEVEYKPHAMLGVLDAEPFNARTYQKAIGSIV
jgi:hypothetical protein